MEFNDLLAKKEIDPGSVIVLRHRPPERELQRIFPWLAAERPETFNAYQQTQNPKLEKSMQRAAYIASFIGHEAGRAVFIGLYKRGAHWPLTYDEYWSKAPFQEMRAFGMRGFTGERDSILWFDLELTEFYSEWKGRLIVEWPPPEIVWWRWANRNRMPVSAVHERSTLDAEMPSWDLLTFTWDELKIIPSAWKSSLREWRGIYLIFDESDGKGYVGSAYGADNILGRWLNYAAIGHGGNKELRLRDPARFRFSILQRVSPDMELTELVRLESGWKIRLHTREFGMNEN